MNPKLQRNLHKTWGQFLIDKSSQNTRSVMNRKLWRNLYKTQNPLWIENCEEIFTRRETSFWYLSESKNAKKSSQNVRASFRKYMRAYLSKFWVWGKMGIWSGLKIFVLFPIQMSDVLYIDKRRRSVLIISKNPKLRRNLHKTGGQFKMLILEM